jgi:predicted O-methyltransferase YrrM
MEWGERTDVLRLGVSRARNIVRLLQEIRGSEGLADVPTLVDMAATHFRPFQIRSEIVELMNAVAQLRPSAAAEIGTHTGGTLFLLCRLSSPSARIISVDLAGGRFGGGYPARRQLLYRRFAGPGQSLHLLRRSSHDPRTLDRVKRILSGRELDFLFIDGDHSYEGVKQDFEMYSPMVRKGGLVAFHEIAGPGGERARGVPSFWREVRSTGASYQELVANPEQTGWGIGLLWL